MDFCLKFKKYYYITGAILELFILLKSINFYLTIVHSIVDYLLLSIIEGNMIIVRF